MNNKHLSWYKEINNNFIIASRAYFFHIVDSINAPGPLTRSRATQLENLCGHFAFVSISEPKKVDEALMEPEWIQAMQEVKEICPKGNNKVIIYFLIS